MFSNGRALRRSDVNSCLQHMLRTHPDRKRISTHSFPIGAATTATVTENVQRSGRWKSDCFATYVKNSLTIPVLDPYG